MALDLNGIIINEIFPSTNANNPSSDTDGNGTIENKDEFVELFNTSTTDSVDIGGWTITSDGIPGANPITFAPGTTIGPQSGLVAVVDYDTDANTLPAGFYDVNRNSGGFRRAGDDIVLTNDLGTESITASYGDRTAGENLGDAPMAGNSVKRDSIDPDTFSSNTPPTPECFITGTRILTELGYKAVEELQIGDKVETAEGELVDVKWIGYQTIDPNAIAIPLRGNPVLVKAGALGNSLPARDLYISPDHSLFVDGLLINAGALVNGISIVQTEPTETFVYHSVELANHALLTVEGTHAESYMPHHEDRTNYDNAEQYEELYPHGSNLMLWPMDYPRVSSKTQVPSFVSQKLLNIAQQLEGEVLVSA